MTTEIIDPGVTAVKESITSPPPPPFPKSCVVHPPPPAPPPPTSRYRTEPTPVGTVQSQEPEVAKVRIVSPFDAVVVVGEHAAAFAVEESATCPGNPAKSVRTKIQEIEEGRDRRRVAYLRRRISKITFTS
jgi:uracil-DNA glycosylase